MTEGLTIAAVDPDDDYLGVEIHASNGRFAGSARIYAGLDELSELASRIAGFPKNDQDQRSHEFGSRDPSIAGGYCSITLRCLDRAGHVCVDVALEDDEGRYSPGLAQFSLKTEAAALDQFVERLRAVQRERSGFATLACRSA